MMQNTTTTVQFAIDDAREDIRKARTAAEVAMVIMALNVAIDVILADHPVDFTHGGV